MFWVTAEQTAQMFFWQLDATWSHRRTEDGRSEKASASLSWPPPPGWCLSNTEGRGGRFPGMEMPPHPSLPLQGSLSRQSENPLSNRGPSLCIHQSVAPDNISVLASGTQEQAEQPCGLPSLSHCLASNPPPAWTQVRAGPRWPRARRRYFLNNCSILNDGMNK